MPTDAPADLEQRVRELSTEERRRLARVAIGLLDLTTLEGTDTPDRVRVLCRRALAPLESDPGLRCASVCVYPAMVPCAAESLARTPVRVASVAAAFPSGQYPLKVKLLDCAEAIRAGADELDIVINRGLFLAGRHDEMAAEVREIRAATRGVHLKVILETGELETPDNIRRAAELVAAELDDGDMLKTSTGKAKVNATPEAARILLETARASGRALGFKPAGGVRTTDQALLYVLLAREILGPDALNPDRLRIGASTLLDDLLANL